MCVWCRLNIICNFIIQTYYYFFFLTKYKENYLWQESVEKKVYTYQYTYFSDKNWKIELIHVKKNLHYNLISEHRLFLYLLILHCLNCILCGMGILSLYFYLYQYYIWKYLNTIIRINCNRIFILTFKLIIKLNIKT